MAAKANLKFDFKYNCLEAEAEELTWGEQLQSRGPLSSRSRCRTSPGAGECPAAASPPSSRTPSSPVVLRGDTRFRHPCWLSAPSNPLTPPPCGTFGLVGVSRGDVLGEQPQALLALIVQPQVQLPPRLELLRGLALEVALTVTHPQLVWVLRETLWEPKHNNNSS